MMIMMKMMMMAVDIRESPNGTIYNQQNYLRNLFQTSVTTLQCFLYATKTSSNVNTEYETDVG